MKLITNLKRKRAIKSYITKLPRILAKDYGKSKLYTPKQVKRSVERSGLAISDACYAIAMFSDKESFESYHQEIGEECSFDEMRSEIAENYFGGDTNFSTSEVDSLSSSYGWSSSTDGSIDGASDGGGDGGD